MIEAKTLDISYKDLKLAVIQGEVDLSSLLIFEEQEIYISELNLKIHAGIIGTSHFFQMESSSGSKFTEILACNADEVRTDNSMYLDAIQDIKKAVSKSGIFGQYAFEYELISFSDSKQRVQNWTQDKSIEKQLFSLEYEFDMEDINLPSSKTILSVFQQGKGILVRTVHEYQEENTTVLSQSILTL